MEVVDLDQLLISGPLQFRFTGLSSAIVNSNNHLNDEFDIEISGVKIS